MQFDKQKFKEWAIGYTNYQALSIEATEAFTGWSAKDPNSIFDKLKDILKVIEKMIVLIEKFHKDVESLSSRDKLEGLVDALDDLIKFNWMLEWADGMIIRYIISVAVQKKNDLFGKEWVDFDRDN